MDLKVIKSIIDLMTRSELSEFEIEEENFKLRIRRAAGDIKERAYSTPNPFAVEQHYIPTATCAPAAAPLSAPAAPKADDANTVIITSPMVGTFYRSPSPDSPVFINIGSTVRDDSVVCIIEAMKVMNEIHAEVSGSVVEILVENGHSVEYGQPLFKVRKS